MNNETHLRTIGDAKLLETVWKEEIRKGVRSAKFRDFYFDQDPAQFAAFEWGLSHFLNSASSEIRAGTYDPSRALVIRGAKHQGLSRPIAMLSLRDSLVYRAIVSRARSDLSSHLRPWTGAFIGDHTKVDRIADLLIAAEQVSGDTAEQSEDSDVAELDGLGWSIDLEYAPEDFWGAWLVNQRLLFHICATCDYVVQSDISNFYASLDLEVVREQLHSHTNLDVEVVRLCLRVLAQVLPHSSYATAPDMGLPQEVFNSSRTIAHSVLVDVDRCFDEKGEKALYTRFVDDFTIGVATLREGEETVSKLQAALEPLGLTVNGSKTRIVRSEQLRFDLMVDENTYLDVIQDLVVEGKKDSLRVSTLDRPSIDELIERFENLRNQAEEDRPKYWERVSLRYLGILRDVGHRLPNPILFNHLARFPKSARHILEYLRSFQLTSEVCDFLLARVEADLAIYGDVPLLCLETLVTSPNSLEGNFADETASRAIKLIENLIGSAPSTSHDALFDRATALGLVAVAKFGNETAIRSALSAASPRGAGSQTFLQAHAIRHSLGDAADLGRHVLAGVPWTNAMTIAFLSALSDKDETAIGSLVGLLQSQMVLRPNRFFIHARPALLLGALARADPNKAQRVASHGLSKLGKNPQRLRDERAEELLRRYA